MKNFLSLPTEITQQLASQDVFNAMMQLNGKAFRDVRGRKTMQVMLGGRTYFIKQHFGVGWREVFKNCLSFKKPILGAMTEVNAIQTLTKLGIATTPLVAFGQLGCNPATLQSFVLTEDLGDIISLEELCADWQKDPPAPDFKQQLIVAMAEIAKKMHGAGLCHRDFYLCHFVLKKAELNAGKINLILIDLHRMLTQQNPHGNTVMKDMAALIFSAKDCGFNAEDWALFKQYYLPQSELFWQKVEARAKKLYQKFHSKKFQQRLAVERSALR